MNDEILKTLAEEVKCTPIRTTQIDQRHERNRHYRTQTPTGQMLLHAIDDSSDQSLNHALIIHNPRAFLDENVSTRNNRNGRNVLQLLNEANRFWIPARHLFLNR